VADPRVYAAPGSAARHYAAGIAWLWRLGGPVAEPLPGAVGFGTAEEADDLAAHVGAGRLACAAVLAGGAPAGGRLRFDAGFRLHGPALRLDDRGRPLVRSSAGVHAAERDSVLFLATTPERWGDLDESWVLPVLAHHLARRLGRPLVALPAVGCLRIDDLPGTAELQLRGRARDDRAMERHVRRIIASVERAGARLLVAVAARALHDAEPVPTDHVWPAAVAALADGVRRRVLEPAAHGLLHLNDAARTRGELDPREFLDLGEDEAGRRIDAAMEWIHDRLGPSRMFVPPAWGCSDGTLSAAAVRGLAIWRPPAPGPLVGPGGDVRETLQIGIGALDGLDYSPLRHIADHGLPPTVVFHGRLLDDRVASLRERRALLTTARLARRRDLDRIPRLRGVAWIGAHELLARLRAHDAIEVRGDDITGPPGTEAVLIDAAGRRPLRL
jgi:hypothetical protein